MTLGAWNDYMGHSEEERERLHREAMAYYNAWIADRDRRHRAYDATVDAYHARLAEAVRRRDEEAKARRGRVPAVNTGEQHDAHVKAWRAQLRHRQPTLNDQRTPVTDEV